MTDEVQIGILDKKGEIYVLIGARKGRRFRMR